MQASAAVRQPRPADSSAKPPRGACGTPARGPCFGVLLWCEEESCARERLRLRYLVSVVYPLFAWNWLQTCEETVKIKFQLYPLFFVFFLPSAHAGRSREGAAGLSFIPFPGQRLRRHTPSRPAHSGPHCGRWRPAALRSRGRAPVRARPARPCRPVSPCPPAPARPRR